MQVYAKKLLTAVLICQIALLPLLQTQPGWAGGAEDSKERPRPKRAACGEALENELVEAVNDEFRQNAVPPAESFTTPDGFTLKPRESVDLKCSYCKDDLVRQVDTMIDCPGCKTSLHEECLNETGFCPSIGCRLPKADIYARQSELTGEQRSSDIINGPSRSAFEIPHENENFLQFLFTRARLDFWAFFHPLTLGYVGLVGGCGLNVMDFMRGQSSQPFSVILTLIFVTIGSGFFVNGVLKVGITKRARTRRDFAEIHGMMERRLFNDNSNYSADILAGGGIWARYLNYRVHRAHSREKFLREFRSLLVHDQVGLYRDALKLFRFPFFWLPAQKEGESEQAWLTRAQVYTDDAIGRQQEIYQKALSRRNAYYDAQREGRSAAREKELQKEFPFESLEDSFGEDSLDSGK